MAPRTSALHLVVLFLVQAVEKIQLASATCKQSDDPLCYFIEYTANDGQYATNQMYPIDRFTPGHPLTTRNIGGCVTYQETDKIPGSCGEIGLSKENRTAVKWTKQGGCDSDLTSCIGSATSADSQ